MTARNNFTSDTHTHTHSHIHTHTHTQTITMPLSKDPRICWETDIFFEIPIWCIQPDVQKIEKVILPYLEINGLADPTVTFFAQGALNKLYTIHAIHAEFGTEHDFVFRVALPVQPYYKTESEAATCNYVRLHTSIPAPRIYAYDSSSENELGFEWMLMEKIPGTPLAKVWDSMEWERKVYVAMRLAEWMDELSRCRFTKVGSLYHSSKANLGGFEVGPAVDFDFYRGRCLQYELDRGPFSTAQQFYQSSILSRRMDVNFYTENVQEDGEGSGEGKASEEKNQKSESEEHEHQDGMEYEKRAILGIPKACDALLKILPQVFPEDSPEKTPKVLYHHDISVSNILVDDAGNLVGLVDWENILTVPYALARPFPKALECIYGEDDTGMLDKPPPPESEEDDNRKTYDELYEKTQLQEVFRKRLEELQSPWLRTFTEATLLSKEFIWNLEGINFTFRRTKEWIDRLAGREDLGKTWDYRRMKQTNIEAQVYV